VSTYTITADDKTRAAIEAAKRNFKSLDKSVKELSKGAAGLGKVLGVGGVVALGLKAVAIASKQMAAAMDAAKKASADFAMAMSDVEAASAKAVAPENIPALIAQAQRLKDTISSPEYIAAAGAWSQYWAERALFVKQEFASLGRMVGWVGDKLGIVDADAVRGIQDRTAQHAATGGTKATGRRSGRGGRDLSDMGAADEIRKAAAARAKAQSDAAKAAATEAERLRIETQTTWIHGLQDRAAVQEVYLQAERNALQAHENFIEMTIDTGMDRINEALKDKTDEITVYADQAARNMQDAFADFLFDPFDKGVKGMAKDFADTLRRMLAEAAASKIFDLMKGTMTKGGGIIGLIGGLFGGRKASGGPVSAGRSYLVGERGPELFSPRSSGHITPNHAMGGTVNVYQNVDARGASADAIKLLPAAMKAASDDAVARIQDQIRRGRL